MSFLGQAASLNPQVEASLASPTPSGYDTDATGAHDFLTRAAWLLEGAGFGVLLPAWWTRKGTKMRLTARASARSSKLKASSGLSLDLMRRDRASDNGLIEFMVTALVRDAPRLGVQRISLNFAVFRSSLARGERIGAGPFLRAWVRMLLVASRWWQIASLYRANAKFRPAWEPRFICFRLARDLGPIIGAALAVEGFLHWPQLIPRRTNDSTMTGASC